MDDDINRWKAEIEEQSPENVQGKHDEYEQKRLELISVLESMPWTAVHTKTAGAFRRRLKDKFVDATGLGHIDAVWAGLVQVPNIQVVTLNSALPKYLLKNTPNASEILIKARDCGLFNEFIMVDAVGDDRGILDSIINGYRIIGIDSNGKEHIIVSWDEQ